MPLLDSFQAVRTPLATFLKDEMQMLEVIISSARSFEYLAVRSLATSYTSGPLRSGPHKVRSHWPENFVTVCTYVFCTYRKGVSTALLDVRVGLIRQATGNLRMTQILNLLNLKMEEKLITNGKLKKCVVSQWQSSTHCPIYIYFSSG